MRRSVYLFVLLLLAALSAPGPLLYGQSVFGGVTAVFAQGDRAYLGEDSTFVILDVSDPAQPVVLSRTLLKDANNGLRDIVVDGEEAYLIGGGFFMYDISDPAHPESLFADPTLKGRGVDVAGGYAYVASRHVTVFNVQDPSDPVRLSEFVTNNRTWDVLVRGDTLYATYDSGPVIDDCEWALFVLDVSDKTNLQALSFYKPRGCSNSVAVHGDIVYLAIEFFIQVLDVANLADLTLIKELPLFGACTLQSNEDLLIAGCRVINNDGSTNDITLTILSLADPRDPVLLSQWQVRAPEHDLHLDGDRLYVAAGQEGVLIYDLSEPTAPELLGSYATATASEIVPAWPQTIRLGASYPNPFRQQTHISYTLNRPRPVRLTVYDVLGRPVKVLVEAYQAAGTHRVVWDGTDATGRAVASGVYFSRLEAGTYRQTKTMTLLK